MSNATDLDEGLLRAAESGELEKVQWYLQRDANPSAKGLFGWTPLHESSQNGHDAVVRLLLEGGAQVDTRDDDGWTPLHWACKKGHVNIAGLLLEKVDGLPLEKGAVVNAKERSGSTSLDVAIENGQDAIIDLLRQNGGKTNKELKIEQQNQNRLRKMAINGAQDFNARQPLLLADKYFPANEDESVLSEGIYAMSISGSRKEEETVASVGNIDCQTQQQQEESNHWHKTDWLAHDDMSVDVWSNAKSKKRHERSQSSDSVSTFSYSATSTSLSTAWTSNKFPTGDYLYQAETNEQLQHGEGQLRRFETETQNGINVHGGGLFDQFVAPNHWNVLEEEQLQKFLAETPNNGNVHIEEQLQVEERLHQLAVETPNGANVHSDQQRFVKVTPNKKDVCFRKRAHHGTKKWHDAVKRFSRNREAFPDWNDAFCDLIQAQLLQEHGIERFLLCRESDGTPSITINDDWYVATQPEISEKTKQRFRDDRKPGVKQRGGPPSKKQRSTNSDIGTKPTPSSDFDLVDYLAVLLAQCSTAIELHKRQPLEKQPSATASATAAKMVKDLQSIYQFVKSEVTLEGNHDSKPSANTSDNSAQVSGLSHSENAGGARNVSLSVPGPTTDSVVKGYGSTKEPSETSHAAVLRNGLENGNGGKGALDEATNAFPTERNVANPIPKLRSISGSNGNPRFDSQATHGSHLVRDIDDTGDYRMRVATTVRFDKAGAGGTISLCVNRGPGVATRLASSVPYKPYQTQAHVTVENQGTNFLSTNSHHTMDDIHVSKAVAQHVGTTGSSGVTQSCSIERVPNVTCK